MQEFYQWIGFLLQIYGQQNLSPAPVAIIFSLEGVFASVFGWIILSQYLNEIKVIGIMLILFAVIFSQLAPMYDKKSMDDLKRLYDIWGVIFQKD